MHQPREPKKKDMTINLKPRKYGVALPISIQVQLAARSLAHRNDKRNTRNKAKAWKQEQGA